MSLDEFPSVTGHLPPHSIILSLVLLPLIDHICSVFILGSLIFPGWTTFRTGCARLDSHYKGYLWLSGIGVPRAATMENGDSLLALFRLDVAPFPRIHIR